MTSFAALLVYAYDDLTRPSQLLDPLDEFVSSHARGGILGVVLAHHVIIGHFCPVGQILLGPNPCAGVKGFTERGRDAYIEDVTYRAVWDAADWPTRDAMDLAYLTGQRPVDVLKMRLPDIRDGFLWLTQGKTRKKLRIAIAGELALLIERIQGRAYKVTSLALIRNETGQTLSYSALDNRFEEARKRAAKALDDAGEEELVAAVKCFQFRDLRAKAGTDKADATDLREAQQQLGHKSVKTRSTCAPEPARRSRRPSNVS